MDSSSRIIISLVQIHFTVYKTLNLVYVAPEKVQRAYWAVFTEYFRQQSVRKCLLAASHNSPAAFSWLSWPFHCVKSSTIGPCLLTRRGLYILSLEMKFASKNVRCMWLCILSGKLSLQNPTLWICRPYCESYCWHITCLLWPLA